MVKTVTSINNNTITFDTDKYIINKLKITNICDSSDSTGGSGDSIVADGNGGWSWGPGGGSGVPEGSSGDVIISDGSSGLDSTNILNVNPTNGTITGTGALTVVGGVGISGNLNVGGNVELKGSLGVDLPAAPDREIFENRPYFGQDLALSRDGKSIAVGSTHDPGGGYKAGAIYVYTRPDLSQSWTLKGAAAIGDPSGIWPSSEFGHQLGRGVSISDDGNTVVGIALDIEVTVIKFSNGTWATTSFYPPQIVYSQVGAPGIHLNASGDIMLITSDANSYQGMQARGSAWVYEYNGSIWTQKGATIHGSHQSDKLGSKEFGPGNASLSKNGLTFSLGRNKVEDGYKGEIVVYDWNETSWNPRSPIPGAVSGEYRMINDLSDDGNTILVSGRSASKIAKVYDWNGTSWVQRGGDLIMPSWQAYFAISGDSNTLLFGNPSSSEGSIDVYKYTSNSWTISKTIQQDGAAFGKVISITPDGNNFATSDFLPFTSTVYTYGLPGADYGTAGQVLSSNGSGSAVSWVSPVSNIYAGASISQIFAYGGTFSNWTSQVASGITVGSTNVFTAQSSGWYSLGFSFNCQGTNNFNNFTGVLVRIKKNGTDYHVLNDDDRPPGSTDNNISITFGGSIFIDLNTNDIITFTIQVNSDNHTVTGYCSLEKTADAPLSVPATEFGEVATSADTQGGKMILKTKDSLNQLTDKVIISNEGKLGFRGAIYGNAGDVLTNNASGLPEWTTPTAPPPGAFGVFYVDGALTIPVNTGQQVNNLVRDTRFPLTGMSILGKQTGNTAQTITVSGGAGNYLFTWTINAQQLSGSTNNVFELYQGGSRLNYNWYIFSGLENIVGSFMVNQTTASADYSFLATATGGGHYRLNGFNNQWTQISITKLF